jgi:RNA polymerase sigma-70 factor (family 1)
MTQPLDDKAIVGMLKKGDPLSFDKIFKRYNKKVYYFALSYLRNKEEAEDIVQEVFLNLWRFRSQINEYKDFSKYLFKITYNLTCKKFRKQESDKRILDEVLKNMPSEDDSTKIEIEYNGLVETTNNLIGKLPSRMKSILVLSIEEHLSPDEIALKLGISRKTVENYLSVARSSLRKSLSEGGVISVLFFWLFIR